jgi:hypothetical protein
MWRTPWPGGRQTPCTRRPARYRPRTEVLEDRCLPSFSFAPAVNYPVSTSTNNEVYVVAADVNGDGKPDLVVESYYTQTVSVLLGNGDGTFQPAIATPVNGGGEPNGLAVGDVNGDGKLDFVVSIPDNDTVKVFLGNGNGTFTAGQAFATGVTALNSSGPVQLADVNGDGKPDIITANLYNSSVSVLQGNGDGTFQAAKTFAAGKYPVYVVVADVTGDGIPDLVVSNGTSTGTLSILQGKGNGTFAAPRRLGTGGAYGASVAVADVNGDGKPDLVVANYYSDTVSVLLGKGGGKFAAPVSFGTGLDPSQVAVADINGDGKPDIVVSNFSSNTVSVLPGLGNGIFQRPVNFGTDTGPGFLAVADVNGDGKPDAITNNYAGDVSVLINTSTPTVTSTVSAGSQPAAGNSLGVPQASRPAPVLWVYGMPGNSSGVLPVGGTATVPPTDNSPVRPATGPAHAGPRQRANGAGWTGDGVPPWLGQDIA